MRDMHMFVRAYACIHTYACGVCVRVWCVCVVVRMHVC